jgi:transcription antitermination factor NusG
MQWYAIYTKSRCEKKVHALLSAKNIEAYCPTKIVFKKWSDRVKKVEEPLFPSYLFVKINPQNQLAIRETNGVVNFVYWLNKPAVIRDKEMEELQQFIKNNDDVVLESFAYAVGTEIKIEQGVFKGQTGVIKKVTKNKIELYLPALQCKLVTKLKQPLTS